MTALGAVSAVPGAYNFRIPNEKNVTNSLPRFKVGYISTSDATPDATNTMTVNLWTRFGIIKPLIVEEFSHTATDSEVVQELLTTTTSSYVTYPNLVITIPAGTNNDKRTIVVYGI